ncbi:hypothetical protein AAGG74_16150 [Bacillus mexicanus]|uniref:hypothetical protein n=1 Tax=Bacillus mexicanus TaxID=2834415 RepID=UPI003D1FAD64
MNNYVIAPYSNSIAMYESDDFRLKKKNHKDIITGYFKKHNLVKDQFNGFEIGIFLSTDGDRYVIFEDFSAKKLDDGQYSKLNPQSISDVINSEKKETEICIDYGDTPLSYYTVKKQG